MKPFQRMQRQRVLWASEGEKITRRIKTSSRLSEKLGYMARLSEVWLGLQEGGRHPGEMIFPCMGWFSYATTWKENHILKHKWHEVTQKPNVVHRWKIFGAHTYFKMGKIDLKYGFWTSLKKKKTHNNRLSILTHYKLIRAKQ